ncbi:MAG: hypothetical protein Ct9H90mP20_7510 [Candidatus Neomarinimicrobiota bacterium]|nr:MAG: hypothetical protein Ct9H90mP20_7510 [Candidatus Neomarinimicrobiota bacterium]
MILNLIKKYVYGSAGGGRINVFRVFTNNDKNLYDKLEPQQKNWDPRFKKLTFLEISGGL